MEALRYQQPKLLQYAMQLMEDPALSWREGVRTLLETCAYSEKKGIAVLSVEEDVYKRQPLHTENCFYSRQAVW